VHSQLKRCGGLDLKSGAANSRQTQHRTRVVAGRSWWGSRRGGWFLLHRERPDARGDGGKIQFMIIRERRHEQHDQAEFKVSACAVSMVFILRSWRGPLAVVRAGKVTMLDHFGCSVLVSAPEANHDAALQAAKYTLKGDGGEDQEGCEASAHRLESISPTQGGVQR
jgi:hypothetical protein